MRVARLTISQTVADELSQKLEVALAPAPLTIEQRLALLEAPKIWFGETPTGGERVLNMVSTSAHPYNFYVIYSLPLPAIKAGDLIEAQSQWEVTNENSDTYMIGCVMIIGDSPTDSYPAGAKLFTRPRTENLTPAMHHMRLNEHGSKRASEDMEGKFLNVIGYCGGWGQGTTIRVEPNYGSVEVKVMPKAMLA